MCCLRVQANAPVESLLTNSSLYREFQAEREEILKHKWIESQKAGRDIGPESALTDWVIKHRSNWRKSRQAALRLRDAAVPDELDLKRELSDICHRTGVSDWHSLVKAIFDWIAAAKGAERERGLEVLRDLVRKLQPHAERYDKLQATRDRQERDEVRARIEQTLKEFVDQLPASK
jgi:hypothetical protein